MNDRIIVKGFYSTSSATHTYEIPTPIKPIGFEYANKNFTTLDKDNDESKSVFDLDCAMLGFRR